MTINNKGHIHTQYKMTINNKGRGKVKKTEALSLQESEGKFPPPLDIKMTLPYKSTLASYIFFFSFYLYPRV